MNISNFSQKFQKFNETDHEEENSNKSKPKLEIANNNNNTTAKIEMKAEDKGEESGLAMINKLIDEMGFSKYHLLICTIAALILICGGIQELMLAIVLSMINEKENLSHYHLALITTSEYIGYTTATILVNIISSYISSKRSIQIFAVLTLISTGVSIFSIQYYLAIISRFFTGICLGMIDILIYLNLIESCPTKIRGFIGSFILIFFPLGQFLISVFCYFQLNSDDPDVNFRNLLLIPFFFVAVLLVLLLPFLQDSARRMMVMKNVKGSVEVMKKISVFNKDDTFLEKKEKLMNDLVRKASEDQNDPNNAGREIKNTNDSKDAKERKLKKANTMFNINKNIIANDKDDKSIEADAEAEAAADKIENLIATTINYSKSFMEQLKGVLDKKHFKFSIIFWILAAITGFIFNGIFFMLPTTAHKLESDTFKDVILSVSMEIPSNFLVAILIENKRLGRLRILKIGYMCTIIICIICFICGYDYLFINCLLKFCITIPANVLLVYGSEIYSGKIRTFGVSTINFFRRLFTIASPFLITFMDYNFGTMGPYYIFFPLTILGFILSLLLHVETRGVPLDQILVK